jgi:hypothetical protein
MTSNDDTDNAPTSAGVGPGDDLRQKARANDNDQDH